MTERAPPRVFLERQTYRRRRMLDAVRLLPIFGALLLAIPMMWPQRGPATGSQLAADGAEAGAFVPMSDAIAYVFIVWAGLIAVSALLGYLSGEATAADGAKDRKQGQDQG